MAKANYEALKLVDHLGTHSAADLLDRMGLLLSHIADTITDEGDRAVLNSTNDADRIRSLAEEWRQHRYRMNNEPTVARLNDRYLYRMNPDGSVVKLPD